MAFTVINQFAKTNPVKKYKTDWKTFILESKMEDFTHIDNETIFVSTIHKAKGKEFNNVILLLNGFRMGRLSWCWRNWIWENSIVAGLGRRQLNRG